MAKFFSSITILLVAVQALLAQQDSLVTALSNATNAQDSAELYYEIGSGLVAQSPDEAIFYLTEAQSLNARLQPSRTTADTYYDLARCFFAQDKEEVSEEYYLKSISLYRQLGEYTRMIRAQRTYLNALLLDRLEFQKALRLALATKDFADSLGIDSVEYRANALLLDAYFSVPGTDKEFTELANRNLELAEQIGDTLRIAISLFNVAVGYSRNLQHEKAIETYKRFLSSLEGDQYDGNKAGAYNNMATQYKKLGLRDSALHYYKIAGELAIRANRRVSEAASHLNIGRLYIDLGKFTSAIDECGQALAIFQDANIVRRQDSCAFCLSQAYKELGNSAKALEYLELAHELTDRFMSDESKHELEVLKKDHEFLLEHVADSIEHAKKEEMKDIEIQKHRLEAEKSRQESRELIIVSVLILVIGLVIYFRFRSSQKQNKIILQQKDEVEHQKQLVDEAYAELEEKNQEIISSISYAKRIQDAILPAPKRVAELIPQSFVLYKPKDIVAGDFYWLERSGSLTMVAVADCTGHGVPGAMVSVVCHNAMNRSVREFGLTDPGEILDKTRDIVIREFNQSADEVKDGMDIALCVIDNSQSQTKLAYSGAHNPLWVIPAQDGDSSFVEVKADKQPVGQFSLASSFTTHVLELNHGDQIYLFSDGFADQFGGAKGKKMKSKTFRQFLLENYHLPLDEQMRRLDLYFESWKGSFEQVDDVCVIGIRV